MCPPVPAWPSTRATASLLRCVIFPSPSQKPPDKTCFCFAAVYFRNSSQRDRTRTPKPWRPGAGGFISSSLPGQDRVTEVDWEEVTASFFPPPRRGHRGHPVTPSPGELPDGEAALTESKQLGEVARTLGREGGPRLAGGPGCRGETALIPSFQARQELGDPRPRQDRGLCRCGPDSE